MHRNMGERASRGPATEIVCDACGAVVVRVASDEQLAVARTGSVKRTAACEACGAKVAYRVKVSS